MAITHLYPSHHGVHVVEMRHKLLTLSLPVVEVEVEEVPSPPYKYTWASMTVTVAIPTACKPIGDEYKVYSLTSVLGERWGCWWWGGITSGIVALAGAAGTRRLQVWLSG